MTRPTSHHAQMLRDNPPDCYTCGDRGWVRPMARREPCPDCACEAAERRTVNPPPCPFCRSDDLWGEPWEGGEISCDNCGARAPYESWQMRPNPELFDPKAEGFGFLNHSWDEVVWQRWYREEAWDYSVKNDGTCELHGPHQDDDGSFANCETHTWESRPPKADVMKFIEQNGGDDERTTEPVQVLQVGEDWDTTRTEAGHLSRLRSRGAGGARHG